MLKYVDKIAIPKRIKFKLLLKNTSPWLLLNPEKTHAKKSGTTTPNAGK